MLEATWIGFSPMIGSLLASLLAVYYFAWCRSRFVRLIDALPGPKTYPFLGNILELNVAHDELLRKSSFDWIKQHGSIYRIWFTVRPMVVIASPELLEPILSSHTLATKADEYDCFIPLLGKSILVAKPEEWKKNRRLLNPAFKGQILNSFMDAFHDKSLLCAKEFEEAIESNSGGKINVFPIMTHCTLDIICETAMGGKTLTGEDKASYIKNLHGFENIFLQRLKQPWLRLDWLFKLSGPGRANERFVGGLRDFSNMLIRHRRELVKRKTKLAQNDLSERDVNPTDELQVDDDTKKNLIFMDLLIKEGDLNGNFNSVEMRDEVSLMMAAGHDTLALAFTWFLYLISRHPDKQKLLMEELSIVFGDSDRPCTVQDLAELKYLECCIKETLRLYPSAPFILRRLPEDVEIGGYVLPKGVTIAMLIYGMHHNPQVYPDPEEFKPERFFPENSVGRHPYAFIPFSAGPRNCIGQKFAMLELKVVLAHLLRRFQFSIRDPTEPKIIPLLDTTLKPKSPVNLIVTKRLLQA
ncbi:cytochrome P450 4c3 isoform X1 [Daphnia magna]|uniref:cytochrome P450 4c3 isoform X1 n=2 Tax=Daphnia magna TaxID=35525 RepID=UPI001E1BB496|nr:cytochrome P450 4c3 isoform X1 [Daphnia magna]